METKVTFEYPVQSLAVFTVDVKELGDFLLALDFDGEEQTVPNLLKHFEEDVESFLIQLGFPEEDELDEVTTEDIFFMVSQPLKEYLENELSNN